jgi:uncharacterized protein (DUF697 family)
MLLPTAAAAAVTAAVTAGAAPLPPLPSQSAIAESVWVALVVFGVRLVAIMGGSWLGSRAGGVKSELQRRCFWMSMVTQVRACVCWNT